jgi:predicted MFS family arabinose efflux permease
VVYMIFSPLISIKNRTRGRKNSVLIGCALLTASNIFMAMDALISVDR